MTEYLTTPEGRRIAYNQLAGEGVGIVFLGGFRSDMEGSKALALEGFARAAGRPFLRFDYSGHGVSEGTFEAGCIGDWYEDARAALALTSGPQILVGSSMGGWIALLLARHHPERLHALITIAAAPDFTEDGFWASLDDEQRATLAAQGHIDLPSGYDTPYRITARLIEDGRDRLILRSPLTLPIPTRFLQGTADTSVSTATATRLLDHAQGPDLRLTLVKDADHSFSTPACLALITATITELS